ncbi:MAG TPA: hypothetical protein DDY43_04510 [Synechococcales bacterium UBA10510]|jgi:hypothetical protein|nr:hypothetical protein [Synechococcales bacterium UBA10510]
METNLTGWTEQEQAVGLTALNRAQARTIERLIADLHRQVIELTSADQIWQLHDFLSIQRHGIEGRFEFRQESILFVFASLVKEGFLNLDELQGLDSEKLAKIMAMSRF